jgi:hypothetical protein
VIFVEHLTLIRRLVADGVRSGTWRGSLVLAGQRSRLAVAPDVPPKYERKPAPAPTSFSPFDLTCDKFGGLSGWRFAVLRIFAAGWPDLDTNRGL